MRILLDNDLCSFSADSVGDAVAEASALAQERGRIIVEVTVDGETWSQDQLAQGADANPVGEIQLTTADPAELVCQTFEDASLALADANRLQQSAADLLQRDQSPQAMKQLNEAIAIWLSVQQAVEMGLELAGIDAAEALHGATVGEDENDASAVEELNTHLQAVQAALNSKDSVALSDTLLYDLPDVVRRWQDMLEELQLQVKSASGKTGNGKKDF